MGMKALVTGASSGLGWDIARELSARGYDLILVARRQDRLEDLKRSLHTEARIIAADLSSAENCAALHEQVKDEGIGILINDAGFGVYGAFDETDLAAELQLIDVNIRAVHILTKLFLQDFKRKDAGFILNVSSSAAFLPGPLLSSYYASKAYVYRLTESIHEELRRVGSHVYIGALCPGPMRTEFEQKADVRFTIPLAQSDSIARAAVDGMFRREMLIVPGVPMKTARVLEKFMPEKPLVKFSYYLQRRRKR